MKLYKQFRLDRKGTLTAPIASTPLYRGPRGGVLTTKNALRFTPVPVEGDLEICQNGYHAGSLYYFGVGNEASMKKLYAPDSNFYAIYEVELQGISRETADGKRVGRSFRLIRRVV